MKCVWLLPILFLFASPLRAQTVVNPATAKLDFASTDHSTIIPVGTAGAGQPTITSYQGMIFTAGTDVTAGLPFLGPGPAVPKATVTTGTLAPFELTLVQLGISSLPACTVITPATCPAYVAVISSSGPGGTSPRSVGSSSDAFSLAPLLVTPLPAGPSAVRIKP